MEIINHEYFVSPEVAKLLKQAGFDWEICDGYITYEDDHGFTTRLQTPHNFNGDNGDLFIDYRGHKEVLSRPTLDIAQRWLREVKGYDVFIVVRFLTNREYIARVETDISGYSTDIYKFYEDAQEAGIKRALELMLKKQ